MLKHTAAVIGAALAASACVVIDADDDDDYIHTAYKAAPAERLYAASVTGDAVTIRAASSGCTGPESFDVEVDPRGDEAFAVTFERVREDYCRAAMPDGIEITYSLRELGLPPGASVRVTNPIGR